MNLCILLISSIVIVNGFPFEKVDAPLPIPLNFRSRKTINEPYSSELFDDDIILTPEQKQYMNAAGGNLEGFRAKRGAPLVRARRWPKNQPIPYYFNANIPEQARAKIRAITKIMSANTCLDYKENGNGPSKDTVTVLHEMTHNLGIAHTQSRNDRDRYVTINFNAMQKGKEDNYEKYDAFENGNFGLPYEYGSAMHYSGWTETFVNGLFNGLRSLVVREQRNSVRNEEAIERDHWNVNKQATMIAMDPAYQYTMGQNRYMTFNDYKLINYLYNCSENCKTNLKCENGGYIHPRDCNKCVCNEYYTGTRCEREKVPVHNVQNTYTTVFEQPAFNSTSSSEYSAFKIDATRLIKAPTGRRLKITITEMYTMYRGGCPLCEGFGVELNDEDLSLVGKIFCCNDNEGLTFISKSNVVGYKAFSSYVLPFWASVTFTVV